MLPAHERLDPEQRAVLERDRRAGTRPAARPRSSARLRSLFWSEACPSAARGARCRRSRSDRDRSPWRDRARHRRLAGPPRPLPRPASTITSPVLTLTKCSRPSSSSGSVKAAPNRCAIAVASASLARSSHKHHELVAAEARDRVGRAQSLPQPRRQFVQQQGRRPRGPRLSFTNLKSLEVDQHHRQRLPLAPRVADLHVQPILQHRSAGQRGQGIVGGQELRRPLGGLPPGTLAAQAIAQGTDAGATQRVGQQEQRRPGQRRSQLLGGADQQHHHVDRRHRDRHHQPGAQSPGRARGDHHRQAQTEDGVLVRALKERHRQAVGHQHRDRGQAFGSAGHKPARSGRWMAGGDRS